MKAQVGAASSKTTLCGLPATGYPLPARMAAGRWATRYRLPAAGKNGRGRVGRRAAGSHPSKTTLWRVAVAGSHPHQDDSLAGGGQPPGIPAPLRVARRLLLLTVDS